MRRELFYFLGLLGSTVICSSKEGDSSESIFANIGSESNSHVSKAPHVINPRCLSQVSEDYEFIAPSGDHSFEQNLESFCYSPDDIGYDYFDTSDLSTQQRADLFAETDLFHDFMNGRVGDHKIRAENLLDSNFHHKKRLHMNTGNDILGAPSNFPDMPDLSQGDSNNMKLESDESLLDAEDTKKVQKESKFNSDTGLKLPKFSWTDFNTFLNAKTFKNKAKNLKHPLLLLKDKETKSASSQTEDPWALIKAESDDPQTPDNSPDSNSGQNPPSSSLLQRSYLPFIIVALCLLVAAFMAVYLILSKGKKSIDNDFGIQTLDEKKLLKF